MKNKAMSLRFLLVTLLICLGSATIGNATPMGLPLGNTGWNVYLESNGFGTVDLFDFGVDRENIWIELDKDFTGGFTRNGTGDSIIVRFTLVDPCQADFRPNIVIRDERILNETGVTWHDFHIALGLRIPGPDQPSYQKWGFDPDWIFTPSDDNPFEDIAFQGSPWLGTPYGNYERTPTQLNMYNATGTPGLEPDGQYHPLGGSDAGSLRIVTRDMQQGDYFILKEWPTTPEPATMSMLVLGGLALLRRKRA